MFVGSIPQELRQIVHEHTADWPVDEVWVGCSGNLTVERVLEGHFKCHSNDVSLYTSCVGSYLANQPFRLEIKHEDYEWLEDWIKTPPSQVATMMLATRLLEHYGRDAVFYERLRQAYRRQWPELHAKTVEKANAVSLRLASYQAEDVLDYFQRLPRDAAVVSFPPFYTGGYESLYKGMDAVFDWDQPEYPNLDKDRLHEVLAEMRRHTYWFYATDHRMEGHEHLLRGVLEKRGNVPIFVYSNDGPKRVVAVRHATEPVKNPRLGSTDVLEGPLALARLNTNQYASLRAQYLAPNILGAAPDAGFALMASGKIIGVLGFKREDSKVGRGDVFLVADFPVVPTQYKRLSKLLVMAALSTEVQRLLWRRYGKVRTVVTSVFTTRPVSMKYRGLMDMVSRDEKGGQGKPFKLVYRSNLGRWTLAEALEMWEEKHAGIAA